MRGRPLPAGGLPDLWLITCSMPAPPRSEPRPAGRNCPLLAFETAALLDCLPNLPGRVVLVSEVGLGIVPLGAVTRLYVTMPAA